MSRASLFGPKPAPESRTCHQTLPSQRCPPSRSEADRRAALLHSTILMDCRTSSFRIAGAGPHRCGPAPVGQSSLSGDPCSARPRTSQVLGLGAVGLTDQPTLERIADACTGSTSDPCSARPDAHRRAMSDAACAPHGQAWASGPAVRDPTRSAVRPRMRLRCPLGGLRPHRQHEQAAGDQRPMSFLLIGPVGPSFPGFRPGKVPFPEHRWVLCPLISRGCF